MSSGRSRDGTVVTRCPSRKKWTLRGFAQTVSVRSASVWWIPTRCLPVTRVISPLGGTRTSNSTALPCGGRTGGSTTSSRCLRGLLLGVPAWPVTSPDVDLGRQLLLEESPAGAGVVPVTNSLWPGRPGLPYKLTTMPPRPNRKTQAVSRGGYVGRDPRTMPCQWKRLRWPHRLLGEV
jgi:hypothetical protein